MTKSVPFDSILFIAYEALFVHLCVVVDDINFYFFFNKTSISLVCRIFYNYAKRNKKDIQIYSNKDDIRSASTFNSFKHCTVYNGRS
ncbi:hypothetical protein T12_14935 [Trichinella patagoniensis]|uniref:Uncharacterized protein n=1 Tax=Trichinella patagoniensis TaxID=990121 RepID=A0A0V0ZFT7_9BILA|nr:hypothetical protein T12_14935 [Trichinella patagoniensis]